MKQPHYVGLDLETEQVAKMPHGKIHCVSIADSLNQVEAYEWGECARQLLLGLIDTGAVFVIHNAAYDVWVLRHHGVSIPPGQYVCTMVGAHCINPQQGEYSLASYGREIDSEKIDYGRAMVEAGLWFGDPEDAAVYDIPYNPVMRKYAMQDVRLAYNWWQNQLPHFECDARLAKAFYELHMPAVEVTMSLNGGLHIDRVHAFKVASSLSSALTSAYADFAQQYPSTPKLKWDKAQSCFAPVYDRKGTLVRTAVNLNSPNDVVSLLLTRGWKPDEFKRKTNRPVTSQAVLHRLVATDDTPEPLRECAIAISSIRSLYGIQNQVCKLLELADKDGFVKGSWHQTGTQTFRYSSSKPNMQNFSVRHKTWGKQVRRCFTPPPGYVMFMGDLSQIELAIVAWYLEVLCDDSRMADGNRAGRDAHDTNTENWYGVFKEDDPDHFDLMRKRAKNGAFAANYGAKAKRLAYTLNISVSEASEILETVANSTSIDPLKQLVWDTMRQGRDVMPVMGKHTGFLYDCLDTRLFYPGISSSDRYIRESSERKAFNALAQGGCASILRKLCNASLPYVQQAQGWFAALVHDEALGYCPEQYGEELLVHLNREWNSLVLPSKQGGVHVRADFKLVDSWADK